MAKPAGQDPLVAEHAEVVAIQLHRLCAGGDALQADIIVAVRKQLCGSVSVRPDGVGVSLTSARKSSPST